MDTDEVTVGIEQLVDHLRANPSAAVNLGDIAGVTEVLLGTMRRYFGSIDTTLYSEFRGLSEYIERARSEIAELRPNDLKEDKIPRAGLELEAIVAATEDATGTIMDAAEEIMSADPNDETYGDTVNDACMRIFEACSFQDITGQRITKVVSTLTYIEERLHGLQDAWGPDIADADSETASEMDDGDPRPDKDLLNGPALDGEGIQQDQVDDLLAADMASDIVVEAAAEGAETSEPENVANGAENGEDIAAEAEEILAAGDEASQDDIDALFDGDADVVESDLASEPASDAAASTPCATTEDADTADKPDDDEPVLDDIVALSSDGSDTVSQDDIDAMFD